MSAIRNAQTKGQPVYAETCPQYLLLLAEAMRPQPGAGCCGQVPLQPSNYVGEDEHGYEGAKLICSPPLRENRSDLDAVWRGVTNGTVTTLSSDHAPGKYDHPMGKKKGLVGGLDFTRTPNGLPGLETRMPLLMSYGVGQRRSTSPPPPSPTTRACDVLTLALRCCLLSPVSIQRFVEICCSQPARLYGLDHRKGEIAPGMDADLVIWYPDGQCPVKTITNDILHHDIGAACFLPACQPATKRLTAGASPPAPFSPARRLHAVRGVRGLQLAALHDPPGPRRLGPRRRRCLRAGRRRRVHQARVVVARRRARRARVVPREDQPARGGSGGAAVEAGGLRLTDAGARSRVWIRACETAGAPSGQAGSEEESLRQGARLPARCPSGGSGAGLSRSRRRRSSRRARV